MRNIIKKCGRLYWKFLKNYAPDKLYLKALFKKRLGYRLNLKNPQTFNEKLQWLKLYDNNLLYSEYADKVSVREHIKKVLGPQYLVPLIGVYSNAEEIDFNKLPEKFVLKCNHGAGYNIVCTNKQTLNIKEVKEKLSGWLEEDFYKIKREYHYKNIKPAVLCEEYLSEGRNNDLNDYKIFCINEEPYMIQVDFNRSSSHTRNIYSVDWKLLDVSVSYPKSSVSLEKPAVLEEMLRCSKILCKGFPQVRVDLYVVNDKVYFGEMTFFSGAGFSKYTPRSFELEMGKRLVLPLKDVK